MKTFDQIREGYVSYAQQKAAHASMAERGKKKKKEDTSDTVKELDTSTLVSYRKKANKQRFSSDKKTSQRTTGVDMANKKLRARNIDKFGKHSPKGVDKMGNPKEDTSDAVKAFLAKGGKIKKLPPAKAQGYHGKDDPGKDVRGMLDKPDTKKSVMGTRKKAKSMGEVTMPPKKEIMKHIGDTKHAGQAREILKKKYGVSDKHADKMINHSMGQSEAMMPEMSGPFGPGPSISKVGLRVMKKGKEVPPTPPKIGVVSYTGGRKDKLPPHLSGKKEDLIIRSKKPTSKLRRDAESRPTGVKEISKGKLGRYMKKVPASAAQAGDMMARPTPGAPGSAAKMDKGVKKFVKRMKGTSMAVDKLTGKAKVPAK